MTPTAKSLSEQIKKAMEGVTPGPWDTRPDRDDFEVYPTFEGPPSIGEWTSIATCHGIYDEVEANAAYFALCNPTNMLVILSALEDAERERDRLHQLVHDNGTPRFNTVCARAEAAEAKLAEAVKVIEPFAVAGEVKLCGEWRDHERFAQTDVGFYLNFGHIRAASRFLSSMNGVGT